MKDSVHNHDVYAEHDCITVWTVDWNKVTFEDVRKLKKFGFDPGCSDDDFVDINRSKNKSNNNRQQMK